MFEDMKQEINTIRTQNRILFDTLCPDNLTSDRNSGDQWTVFQRGPHMWRRTLDFENIDTQTYECVYCLKTKVKE